MNEYTASGAVEVAADDNAAAALLENARLHPSRPALAHRVGDAFVDVSTAEFAKTARELARGLIGLGIEPRSRVALFMRSRIEFAYLDYAVWLAGCTTVTIYETSSADQVEWIMGNSEAVALVCGTQDLEQRYREVADRLPQCKHVFVVDRDGLDELRANGDGTEEAAVDQRVAAIAHDDLATLVYTSGTTGRPKGCMITHGNFIWDVRQVISEMEHLFSDNSSTLMFLPLAHILARVVQVGCVTAGAKVGFSTGIANLSEELGLFGPTWVFSVPRVFEKVFNTAQSKAGGGLQRRLFDHAVNVAISYSREKSRGGVSVLTSAQHALLDRLVYARVRAAFGGRLEFAISGGAPLGERLGHFFNGAGVLVLEGYGLTETTAAATVNTPDAFKIGTVGRPVPGASVRIADDGEIMLRGGMVFAGYWHNEEATADVLDDEGWFATGDVGELDADGFLRITGRKKELIVTAGGKNVAPAALEDSIRAHALVSQVVVVGDQRPFIAALVTLDAEELAKYAESRGLHTSAPAELTRELLEDEQLLTTLQQAVDDANQSVSKAESIREFRVLEQDFTIDGGELTPTLKVKRAVVAEKYATVIDRIYTR